MERVTGMDSCWFEVAVGGVRYKYVSKECWQAVWECVQQHRAEQRADPTEVIVTHFRWESQLRPYRASRIYDLRS